MSKIIEVNPFDIRSIRAAQAEIDRYTQWCIEKANELCRRLAEVGANVAGIHFAGGFIDGNDDVTITINPLNDGYEVVASGQSVCFLEFGTGVAAGNGYDTSVLEPPVDISPGSWSSTQGKGHFSKHGYWFSPEGHYYKMTVPRMGMYHAVQESKRQIEQIAKEVFSD